MEFNWTEVGNKKQSKKNNDDFKTWRGEEEGESIYGKVTELKEVTKKDGTVAHVMSLVNDVVGENYTVWPKGQLLKKLQAAEVGEGSMIKIEFEGFKPLISDPNRSYRAYKLYVAEE